MIENINDRIKQKFVTAIKDGLNETKLKAQIEHKEINNAIHFEKMDNIANSLINALRSEPNFRIVKLIRGSYVIVLIFDTADKILFSTLSDGRFKTLLNRQNHSKTHYWDALIDFNESIGFERVQQVIDESCFEKNEEINRIKQQITDLLDGQIPEKYVTVCFGMEMFRLCSVEAILTSEHFEIIERSDWSDIIEIDYNDIMYDDDLNSKDEGESLEISVKSDILNRNNSSEEIVLPIKKETKENI